MAFLLGHKFNEELIRLHYFDKENSNEADICFTGTKRFYFSNGL